MMDTVGKRLKLSTEEIECIKYVCENHMLWWELPRMKKTRLLDIALNKNYHRLTETTKCDEMSRLYL